MPNLPLPDSIPMIGLFIPIGGVDVFRVEPAGGGKGFGPSCSPVRPGKPVDCCPEKFGPSSLEGDPGVGPRGFNPLTPKDPTPAKLSPARVEPKLAKGSF